MSPLPKPSEAAAVAQAAYSGPWKWTDVGVRAMDARLGPWRCIAYEGTTSDFLQITRDIRFLPFWDRRAGIGPIGFVKGVLAVIEDLVADCIDDAKAGNLIVLGHSLGGSLALRTAGHFRALGYKVPVFAIEPARCCLWKLGRLLADVPVFISQAGSDPVPDVPLFYRHPGAVTRIGHPVADPLNMIARIKQHRIAQVIADLRAAGL